MFIRTPILFAIPLVLILFIALFLTAGHAPASAVPGAAPAPQVGTISIFIDYGDGSSAVLPETEFQSGESILAVFARAMTAAGIGFGARDYGSTGMVVTEINGHQNGTGDRFWEYHLHGGWQTTGVDQVHLFPGDTLDWKFAVFSGR